MPRLVILETPYRGDNNYANLEKNIEFARACMRDCFINHNESPFVSHLLYTQEGILNDNDPNERALGIKAGLAWGSLAEATVVYTDKGISKGMKIGIQRAEEVGRPVEYRTLKFSLLP